MLRINSICQQLRILLQKSVCSSQFALQVHCFCLVFRWVTTNAGRFSKSVGTFKSSNAFNRKSSGRGNTQKSFKKSGGICYPYNEHGICRFMALNGKCTRKHVCLACGGPHPKVKCPQLKEQQNGKE